MIKEHIVAGHPDSTYHDFVFTQTGMNITISAGSYSRAGQTLFTDANGGTITIPTPTEDTEYAIMLASDGIHLFYDVTTRMLIIPNYEQYIDRLGWFIVPANTTTLDNVEINVIRMTLQEG